MTLSPETRATLYSSSIFLCVGTAAAYSGIWFAQKGLSNDQIGMINAVPMFILLLINIFVGKLADRASDWRSVIIIGSWVSGLSALGLFFTEGYWPILIAWSLVNIGFGAISSVIDAANTRLTARRGTSYGAIRAWATVGYVASLFATGPLITTFGAGIFIPLFAGFAMLRALASLALPKYRSDDAAPVSAHAASHLGEMFRPWLFLPLVAWSLIQSTNWVFMAFQAKFFHEQGLSENVISFSIALGAIGETVILFSYPWLKRNFTPQQLVLTAGLTAVARWALLAMAPGVVWVFPLQLLNAVTYAVGFLGIMAFITEWTHEEIAAEAQSFLGVLQQIASVIMVAAFGQIAAVYGVKALFASSAMAALAVIILLYTLWKAPPPKLSAAS
jgi:MFS transporter, PPP family, 3-phenylpropionic acid transporter